MTAAQPPSRRALPRNARPAPAESPDACSVNCVHPQAVALARAALATPTCVAEASALLKAVADPTRLRILSALAETELCVCDLSAAVGISESAVSHQLRLLRDRRLVAFRREGRVAYYRLLDAHVTDLIRSAVDHARETAPQPQ